MLSRVSSRAVAILLVTFQFGLGIVKSSWCMTGGVPCCGSWLAVLAVAVQCTSLSFSLDPAPCPLVINKPDFYSGGNRKLHGPTYCKGRWPKTVEGFSI